MSPSTKAAFNTGGQILPPALQTALLPPLSVLPPLPSEPPERPPPPPLQARPAEPPPVSTESPSASPVEDEARSAIAALTPTQRLSKINFWQTQGIKALLDRDLDQAVRAYRNAYALWPEFRNVDEIQRLLKSPQSSPKDDKEWKNLYKQITRYDLRGVDPAIIERLRQEARAELITPGTGGAFAEAQKKRRNSPWPKPGSRQG